MIPKKYLIITTICLFLLISAFHSKAEKRVRIREMGAHVGILKTGKWNSIADINGIKVGHFTLIEGENIRTGVTAILPHPGNIFQEKVPGAIYIGNGFGKLTGISQVEELGNIETPIVLTNTLSVPAAWEGILDYVLSLQGNENVRSVNPVVGETNDGFLNDIRGRHIKKQHVLKAIENAKEGPVEEGCVGAGTGTVCFGFKGGIGTSSRALPPSQGGYTVGVLVQTNFGGVLQINGAPVGVELGKYYLKDQIDYELVKENHSSDTTLVCCPLNIFTEKQFLLKHTEGAWGRNFPMSGGCSAKRLRGACPHRESVVSQQNNERCLSDTTLDGSCMIVIATDAPLDSRNLKRLAKRAMLGLAKTGGISSNGSGDYVIAFSTAKDLRIPYDPKNPFRTQKLLENDFISSLFLACIEATEEAIYNSLFMAESMKGRDGNFVEALPLEMTKEILIKYNQIKK